MRSTTISATARITIAWAVLVAITLVSWLLGNSGAHREAAALTVLVLAVVKARVVLRQFMEVRGAPRWLRYGTDLWLLGFTVVIGGTYLW
ncbi:putative cytochrome C oxidase subunit IV [Nocardia nova SH22a]|uniref:Putative cytochrome C oxidase subunit IV n=1 Tax=Nocardia nova SH22a TaxID=1415166 RepID=W5TJF3_9NOCA|nr:cytochrome C oxidase subunit IV family protein [Nocardia nova]AHH19465.1 putative cytochrome C oxidase subunit IV [Nocardia nova SH22a]